MARIVNVIHKPHLVSFRAYETSDYRCCTVCDYKVVIETDDEQLLVASVMDDSGLRDFNIDEAIRKTSDLEQNQDWFYAVEMSVGEKDFDNFINGDMEQGYKAIETFTNTISALRETGHRFSNELRQQLENLADEINGLLKK